MILGVPGTPPWSGTCNLRGLCSKRWADMLKRVRSSELQHGVMSGVSAQLDVAAAALQRPPPQGGYSGYQGAPRDLAADLHPFPASNDYPSSEVRTCCTFGYRACAHIFE